MKHPDQPLEVRVRNGVLSISIGINTLATAYEKGLEDEDGVGGFIVTFPNKRQFAKDVMYAMLEEDETGASALTEFLDKMMDEAVNQGSTGIDFPEAKDETDIP